MPSRATLITDETYARLRDLIVSNVLRAGQKLVDRDLAEALGVSRTPIREALGRLAMTGLIEQRARRGYYVCHFTVDQVIDLYEFRKMLETHSIALAARNAKPAHLREFEAILSEFKLLTGDPKDHARAVKLDVDIHRLIALAAANNSLQMAMENVLDKLTCFVSVEIDGRSALKVAYDEHEQMYEYVKNKDEAGASALMLKHIDNAERTLVRLFEARNALQRSILGSRQKRIGASNRSGKMNEPIE
ncbi:MAG: GntR family transcriptional regulator, partial [Mesorhizobium sp.]|uniref:GntR family transcriptional regulator n=1 Tax=Mesorhizobium sp. TaxID=1871066 RepID=UPI000FE8A457